MLSRPCGHVCGPDVPCPDSAFFGGDTMYRSEVLAGMLGRLSVPPEMAARAEAALRKTDFPFRRLRPGDSITFAYQGLELVGFTYHRDMVTNYEVRFDSANAVATRIDKSVDTVSTVVRGAIKGSLWNTMIDMGESPALVVNFAEILSYEVDFLTEVQEGDSFEMLVDKYYVDSVFFRAGHIHAAHYNGKTGNYYGFYYKLPSGHWDYYNEKGQSLRKTVLRSPLQYAKVTSHFGMRFHPIHRVYRQHQGVDYGAPTGTPVSAIADGRVTFAGWRGGYGRLVILQHSSGLSSRYGHLSGFGSGVKSGRAVHQGQTIGYVGMTGDATGPHLHFEIRRNGTPTNPLKVIPPRADPVPKKYMDDFRRVKDGLLAQLAGFGKPDTKSN